MEKTCPICAGVIRGRSDKRFCSDQCRTTYNNQLNSQSNNLIRNINHILKRNRRLLTQMNPHGKTKVHRDKLLEVGFNFNYFTSEYITQKGNTYRFCYDYGYLPLENDFYALVVRQDYVL